MKHWTIISFSVLALSTLALIGSAGCGTSGSPVIPASPETASSSDVQQLVSSEEMILALTRRLGPLNRSAMNLKLPSGNATSLFSDDVLVADIDSKFDTTRVSDYLTFHQWQVQSPDKLGPRGFWSALISQVAYFEDAKFYFIDGQFSSDRATFDSNMGFSAHARMTDEAVGYASAKMHVTWSWADSQRTRMQITSWETKHFECSISDNVLFQDVTRRCVSDSEVAGALATSIHEQMTRTLILGKPINRPKDDKYPFFFPEVTLEHPAVSVVDLDGNGLDDFFLVRPHLPALFFLNQGDGTFSEIGKEIGLDLDQGCTCSLFADYDNDGDQDVFVGRARKRALYLENEFGKFSDRTAATIKQDLPFMVSSISAADFNNDGLLDVYFSTYSPIEGSHGIVDSGNNVWPSHFLNAYELNEYLGRRAKAHPYIDMTGPPNLLLENKGDVFVVSQHNREVESWRKSFQSSWSDFDRDGDPDLYVCNDFAPDDLYRNDGSDGFKLVSHELGLDQLGFGMGVAWGDHDNDGSLDLYISNMYSKAGTRITQQIQGLDPRIRQMASGNYLYEYREKKFELVSMAPDRQAAVAKAGWSWGGQFADIDNDGHSDIFVASGYYSAPADVAENVDL